jgi:hypothetical protein
MTSNHVSPHKAELAVNQLQLQALFAKIVTLTHCSHSCGVFAAANFCVGLAPFTRRSDEPLVYVIDFAFATEASPDEHDHENAGFLGTPGNAECNCNLNLLTDRYCCFCFDVNMHFFHLLLPDSHCLKASQSIFFLSADYASSGALCEGLRTGPRDDLESLCYT